MTNSENQTYRNIPSKYVRYLFEPRFSVKKDGKTKIKYFPEHIEKGIELIVTNRLGYKPIREGSKKVKNPEGLDNYLGNLEIRRIENSLEMWEYVTQRSLSMLIGSDYRMVINKKRKEINEIKDKLVKVIELPKPEIRINFLRKVASLFW